MQLQIERSLQIPKWEKLSNGEGLHLIFGSNPHNSRDWTTVDILGGPNVYKFDLLRDDWPWTEVAAIHCIGMLSQFDYVDSIKFVEKCHRVLRVGGIVWLSEPNRDIYPGCGRNSIYSQNSLGRIAELAGFNVGGVRDITGVTGRIHNDSIPDVFVLRLVKLEKRGE